VKIIILFFISLGVFASDPFRLAKSEMRNGNYIYSLVILKNIKGDNQVLSQRSFLEGICYSQVADHSKAIEKFIEANKLNKSIPDYFYEFGKALYFAKELERSKKSFLTSISKNSQITGSLFYLAKIAQTRKEFRQAKVYIKQILAIKNLNPRVTQDALYQLGDIHLKISKNELKPEDMKPIVSKHVLPYYENALKTLPTSENSKKIQERVELIKKKYDLL
jgi:tetratricopeptide (TPR) repeat protein